MNLADIVSCYLWVNCIFCNILRKFTYFRHLIDRRLLSVWGGRPLLCVFERAKTIALHTAVRTGPYRAVRRVGLVSDSQSRNPERVKVGVGQREGEGASSGKGNRRKARAHVDS